MSKPSFGPKSAPRTAPLSLQSSTLQGLLDSSNSEYEHNFQIKTPNDEWMRFHAYPLFKKILAFFLSSRIDFSVLTSKSCKTMQKILRGKCNFQYGIIRQVATSEAPVNPQPAFRQLLCQELIATKLWADLVIITGNYSCGNNSGS